MDKKQLIETICAKTGMSKRNLARLLNTSHTNFTKYVAGTRNLPIAAMQQLVALHSLVNQQPPVAAPAPTLAELAALQQALAVCGEKKVLLQKKYDSLQLNWQCATATLQLVAAMEEQAHDASPKKQRWLEEQRYQAEKLLADNGWAARQKVQWQMALLQKEAELYTAITNEIETAPPVG